MRYGEPRRRRRWFRLPSARRQRERPRRRHVAQAAQRRNWQRLAGAAYGVSVAYFGPNVAAAAAGLLYRGWYAGAMVPCLCAVAVAAAAGSWMTHALYRCSPLPPPLAFDPAAAGAAPDATAKAMGSGIAPGGTSAVPVAGAPSTDNGTAVSATVLEIADVIAGGIDPRYRPSAARSPDASAVPAPTTSMSARFARWYFMADVATAVAIGAVTGLQPYDGVTACRVTACAAVAVSVCFAALVTVVRPLEERVARWFAVAAAWGQVAAMVLAALSSWDGAKGATDGDESTTNTSAYEGAFETVALALTALFIAEPVSMLCVLGWRRYCRRRTPDGASNNDGSPAATAASHTPSPTAVASDGAGGGYVSAVAANAPRANPGPSPNVPPPPAAGPADSSSWRQTARAARALEAANDDNGDGAARPLLVVPRAARDDGDDGVRRQPAASRRYHHLHAAAKDVPHRRQDNQQRRSNPLQRGHDHDL